MIKELLFHLFAINFTNFSQDFINWTLTPFQAIVGFLIWPIIFTSVIVFIYVITENIGSTIAAIFIVFALFGTTNAFIQAPEFSSIFFIVTVAGLAGLVLTIFVKRRFET